MVELKKTKAEYLRVQAAKAEMEYQIELKREEIQRLEGHLSNQETAEREIKNKLNEMEKNK